MSNKEKLISIKKTILEQNNALESMSSMLDKNILDAINVLDNKKGKIVITGIGKSGHIGMKISATLSSTGSPAIFINSTEANHGDLGLIEKNDVILALSKSGETKEMVPIINYAKKNKIKLIAITANSNSYLSKNANVTCKIPNIKESCPLNLAPTTSTTMMLVLGDTIAIELMKIKKFKKQDFKKFHPGGMLGKSLLCVENIMHVEKKIPLISKTKTMKEALLKMTSNGFGCVGVIDKMNNLIGIITDGDLRRNISKNFLLMPIDKIMTKKPYTIEKKLSVLEALNIMNKKKITALFITENNSKKPLGIIHIHDCLKIG